MRGGRPPALYAKRWSPHDDARILFQSDRAVGRIIRASLERAPAEVIARYERLDPALVRRVIRKWNETGAISRLRPLVLKEHERARIVKFVHGDEVDIPNRLRPAGGIYVEALVCGETSGGVGLRAACFPHGEVGYQRAHHLVHSAAWDYRDLIKSLAWLGYRRLGFRYCGVRDVFVEPRGWGAALELLGKSRGRYCQLAFSLPAWRRMSDTDLTYEQARRWSDAVRYLPEGLHPKLTNLGWLHGGLRVRLDGAGWCVKHHGDYEPWTELWRRLAGSLVPGDADLRRLQRHLALLSLAQVFMLEERRARTPLWRRVRARWTDWYGFASSPLDIDEEPYYWQDGRYDD